MGIDKSDNYQYYSDCEVNRTDTKYAINLQIMMNNVAEALAAKHHFTKLETSYFYLFSSSTQETLFNIECDVLDISKEKIALDCYLYKKNTNSFVAKSFFVFIKV